MNEEMIEPCPFCGDSMEAVLGLLRHVDPTADCPIRQQSWPVETIAAWNTRAYNPNERLREALDLRVLEAAARGLLAKVDGNSSVRWQFVNELACLRSALSPLPQGED